MPRRRRTKRALSRDFSELLEAFAACDVSDLVVGAHAVGAHGRPRMTKDRGPSPRGVRTTRRVLGGGAQARGSRRSLLRFTAEPGGPAPGNRGNAVRGGACPSRARGRGVGRAGPGDRARRPHRNQACRRPAPGSRRRRPAREDPPPQPSVIAIAWPGFCDMESQRFLRPRGDAPTPAAGVEHVKRVPPPTRRCTARAGCGARREAGSSAHAEMHRRRRREDGGNVWFLRPRGDAPGRGLGRSPREAVPPPTRRCTSLEVHMPTLPLGSSAHAEMHRRRLPRRDVGQRFLRPRGDAPLLAFDGVFDIEVPPPTRRCTAGARSKQR